MMFLAITTFFTIQSFSNVSIIAIFTSLRSVHVKKAGFFMLGILKLLLPKHRNSQQRTAQRKHIDSFHK